jgi:2-dehydropantoate 2-reductase
VGATIGARLAQSGQDVVLVARGEHRAALAADGLRFRAPDGEEVLRLPVAGGAGDVALGPQDVLVLATKTQHTAAALREWAVAPVQGGGTAGERLPVLCAQNGVENERLAARWFDVVLGACVWLPATHLRPGEVVASGAPLSGMLQVGRYPRGLDAPARRVAAALDVEHLASTPREDVMRWKRGKLLDNLSNALDAVCRDGEDWSDLAEAVTAEGQAVLDRLGLDRTSDEEERATRGDRVTVTAVAGEQRGGGSTWQSLARGLDTEVEHLNGEVALLGHEAGVPTPLNAALVRLVTQGQREGRGPRWLDPDVLRRMGRRAAPEPASSGG